MTEESLKKLTTESLINQKKGQKVMLWLLLGVSIALLTYLITDMMNGKEFKANEFIIPLCAISGGYFVWNDIRKINKELSSRDH